MFIRFLFILTNWYIQFEEGIDKHVTMDKESILSDCYLFLVQKVSNFLRMFGPFSQSSPFLVSFYTLDFLFSQAI